MVLTMLMVLIVGGHVVGAGGVVGVVRVRVTDCLPNAYRFLTYRLYTERLPNAHRAFTALLPKH